MTRGVLSIDDSKAFRVARAGGAGTGRFVARALLDPLTAGSPLVGWRLHGMRNETLADFIFSRELGASLEIIRCHLGPNGKVRECEVLRHPGKSESVAWSLECSELTRLLQTEENISSVAIGHDGISLVTPAGSAVVMNWALSRS
jgi:hypothetical protein